MSDNNPLTEKLLYFFEIFMVLVYLGIGMLLFVDDRVEELFQMTHKSRIILAGIIVSYGIFKIYRVVRKKKEFSSQNEDE